MFLRKFICIIIIIITIIIILFLHIVLFLNCILLYHLLIVATSATVIGAGIREKNRKNKASRMLLISPGSLLILLGRIAADYKTAYQCFSEDKWYKQF